MDAILKRLHAFGDDELLGLSEAIDIELERRTERMDPLPDSARRRANARQQSYRRTNGSAAPPIRAIGLQKSNRFRAA